MSNPLLDSRMPTSEWLARLPNVSAKLYEVDISLWERFEPVRKRLAESLSWLHWEGELDLSSTPAAQSIRVMQRALPSAVPSWPVVSEEVLRTLGPIVLTRLLSTG